MVLPTDRTWIGSSYLSLIWSVPHRHVSLAILEPAKLIINLNYLGTLLASTTQARLTPQPLVMAAMPQLRNCAQDTAPNQKQPLAASSHTPHLPSRPGLLSTLSLFLLKSTLYPGQPSSYISTGPDSLRRVLLMKSHLPQAAWLHLLP